MSPATIAGILALAVSCGAPVARGQGRIVPLAQHRCVEANYVYCGPPPCQKCACGSFTRECADDFGPFVSEVEEADARATQDSAILATELICTGEAFGAESPPEEFSFASSACVVDFELVAGADRDRWPVSLLAEMAGTGGFGEIQLWRLPPNQRLLYAVYNTGRIDVRFCLPEGGYKLFGRLNATDGLHTFSIRLRLEDLCPGDVDCSGVVAFEDVLAVIGAWGDAGGPADVDGSGVVDFGDVLAVLAAWGPCA